MTKIITVLLFFLALNTLHAQDELRLVYEEDIFVNAPFKSCHAATICLLDSSKLMAA